ncbi:DUF2927 domain-containing protein [Seohaeicola saemankumensis]|nr:DUF2927 domain-containing protein [Seohaeicola saemankumensis]MCA0869565.1 DUF2927 domain-containing protein [Seohaeicola saemankumensis]
MRGTPISRPRRGIAGAMVIALALAGCETTSPRTSPVPPARPVGYVPASPAPVPASSASQARALHYQKVQDGLLTRGLLRTDGGGPDTPFSPDELVRAFETIAFYGEYSGTTFGGARALDSGTLSRWSAPVRIAVEFGASVPAEQRSRDSASISAYASRLARVTGHSIATTRNAPNFTVFVAGVDDGDYVAARVQQLIPGIGAQELALFRDIPSAFYCLLVAAPSARDPNTYARAVALIPAEHPDLMRQSCFHEEIAQGLGLPNDSPAARPSIFNDDDEFALLTNHDELLLRMLYDPRLKPGMTAPEALPAARIIARELMGQVL